MQLAKAHFSWNHSPVKNRLSRKARKGQSRVTAVVSAAEVEDMPAFERLCEQARPRVLKTLYRITRNREDAEDAVQDSLLSAFVHRNEFDGRSSFATWFTRIAINSALMILRKRRAHPEQSIDDNDDARGFLADLRGLTSSVDPEKLYAQKERDKVVKEAVTFLRPNIRKAVELGQLQEKSMKETAEVLGISVAAAKARLFHARVALRKSKRLKSLSRSFSPGSHSFRRVGAGGSTHLSRTWGPV